jgi:hypothetical protein
VKKRQNLILFLIFAKLLQKLPKKTIVLEIEDENDEVFLQEIAKRLNQKNKSTQSDKPDFIQQLLQNPIKINDFKPLTRDF